MTDTNMIDVLVRDAVFGTEEVKKNSRLKIRELAAERGIVSASIDGLYLAAGKGAYSGITVPASNIRGITYDVSRAMFSAVIKDKVGPFIFEIARSEMGYTLQRPDEYAVCILAAAIREGYKGLVFIQGDHFQVSRKKYSLAPEQELFAIKELIREAVNAGFLNIDIDASTIVDMEKPTIEEQQEENCKITADMTKFMREIAPKGVTISVGGEIGEIGGASGHNSTVEDLRAFMNGYLKALGTGIRGISKISVQTGTSHGGVVLPDGSMAKVEIDFKVLKELSLASRKEYGLGGAVQHGASTLPDDAFHMFPQEETVEVHLATGFQNIIMDSTHLPQEMKGRIRKLLLEKYALERKPKDTEEQFIYKTRKKAFGDFKQEMWNLPESNLKGIRDELAIRFSFLFHKLNVTNTVDLVKKFVSYKP